LINNLFTVLGIDSIKLPTCLDHSRGVVQNDANLDACTVPLIPIDMLRG
jgi:hypothetical protein